ncbi:hypothetical protein [Microvirga arabica]|uniref:hypothetical protein n=1 Tax=Microvirga arabica TaxID=1128671 RepID=UPI00193A78AE|nr:hypothetical protein [Microvirga arabica]MBM1170187.1 hypothetical protein [Microvirga arabica]
MHDLSTTIVAALNLGAGFREHDERPQQAAQAFFESLGQDRLDTLVETLWGIIEHKASTATQVLEAWHVMQCLKSHRRHL